MRRLFGPTNPVLPQSSQLKSEPSPFAAMTVEDIAAGADVRARDRFGGGPGLASLAQNPTYSDFRSQSCRC